ncbi:L,D-transpeptidase [Pelosinus fermentans]|uniref:ErfK/YbiS/YcfS/YnhG family protein n=1 Tax=Pelosinus fermentans JBW45 TaxID=1192197 RepID=I8TXP3_9FIRM|nr:L,D-transpeptidase [Pelosinus fermentans]AJQ28103.1 ErfK/YbiS/YcfS/YnhG family protein [Pelosinus fermentans JBW45]
MFCFSRIVISIFVLLIFILLPISAAAQQSNSPQIIINLPSRTLQLYYGNTMSKEYYVAIGKPSTPTPMGNFYIVSKERDPIWIPPGRNYVVMSGPDNPLGYRWMEFLPLYGIHGTNAPWTIGMAVSNGCVRMLEEEAEELFDIVTNGTPVTITYERIKIDIGKSGKASIGIYPDVYGYNTITLADVNAKLAEYGYKGFVNEEFLSAILREESGKQIEFAKEQNIRINHTRLEQKGILVGNSAYLPVWAVAAACKSGFIWDAKKELIWKDNIAYKGLIKNDIIYSKIDNIEKLFSLRTGFQEHDELELNSD